MIDPTAWFYIGQAAGSAALVIAAGVPLLRSHINNVHKCLQDIDKRLAELNGGLRETKVWQQQHEKRDDDRHGHLNQRMDHLETSR